MCYDITPSLNIDNMKQTKLFYIALPYTHASKEVVEQRVDKFAKFDSFLNLNHIQTVSPILKHLLITKNKSVPGDWNFWKTLSYTYLARCDALVVYQLEGWEESVGVTEEIKYAQEHKIPIIYIPEYLNEKTILSNFHDFISQT